MRAVNSRQIRKLQCIVDQFNQINWIQRHWPVQISSSDLGEIVPIVYEFFWCDYCCEKPRGVHCRWWRDQLNSAQDTHVLFKAFGAHSRPAITCCLSASYTRSLIPDDLHHFNKSTIYLVLISNQCNRFEWEGKKKLLAFIFFSKLCGLAPGVVLSVRSVERHR